ncbi:hypothetical protein TNCV_1732371 [Trichonephila clavipes]|nr:hypothetical protein TNCV_1732371 [Trichonephila clavipes]
MLGKSENRSSYCSSLEDAVKNGWTMENFIIMMVVDDLRPQQIGKTDSLSVPWPYFSARYGQTTYGTCHYELSFSLSNTFLSSRFSDISPIKHAWDMMGRRLHLPGNAVDLSRQFDIRPIPQQISHVTSIQQQEMRSHLAKADSGDDSSLEGEKNDL